MMLYNLSGSEKTRKMERTKITARSEEKRIFIASHKEQRGRIVSETFGEREKKKRSFK